ncbi:MAG: AEC family transporter [Firmicutes bacterium]|nr:AEC family transporter [Bacillota bacterium]
MLDILVRAGSFVAVIILGYALKRIGFFQESDFTLLSKITIRITLSAAIVCNFASLEIDVSLLTLALLGLGGGLAYMALGYLTGLKKSREYRAFAVLNLSGYNIGCFTLPFAQSFLGPVGVITCSLFDVGNAVICLGGAFSVASMVKDGGRFSVKRIVSSLARSVPFVCYLIMVILNLTKIPVPGAVVSCARMIADANAFMAMLMIGVGFKLGGDRSQLGRIVKLLSIRYALAAVLALTFYHLLPFDLAIRQALVILVFSPIGSAVPGFTGEMKGDVGLSSALNSISIVISIVIIVTLLSVML